MMQTRMSLQYKGKNERTTCSGIGVVRNEKMHKETAPVSLQEGAGGLSFTVVCVPKGMHGCPRVRDDYTAAVTR